MALSASLTAGAAAAESDPVSDALIASLFEQSSTICACFDLVNFPTFGPIGPAPVTPAPVTPVPVPAAIWLMAGALAMLGAAARRRV